MEVNAWHSNNTLDQNTGFHDFLMVQPQLMLMVPFGRLV